MTRLEKIRLIAVTLGALMNARDFKKPEDDAKKIMVGLAMLGELFEPGDLDEIKAAIGHQDIMSAGGIEKDEHFGLGEENKMEKSMFHTLTQDEKLIFCATGIGNSLQHGAMKHECNPLFRILKREVTKDDLLKIRATLKDKLTACGCESCTVGLSAIAMLEKMNDEAKEKSEVKAEDNSDPFMKGFAA